MKRTVLLTLACMVMMPALMGQGRIYLYHNIGDTINGLDTIYHHQWDYVSWVEDNNHLLYDLNMFNSYNVDISGSFYPKFLRYCYTETPIDILGLAAVFYATDSNGTIYSDYDHDTRLQEYLYLYEASSEAFEMKGEVPIHATDTNIRHLKIPMRLGPNLNSCCPTYSRYFCLPIREYYFNKAIRVEDSFYVGMSTNSNSLMVSDYGVPISAPGGIMNRGLYSAPASLYDGITISVEHNYEWFSCDTTVCPFPPIQHYRYLSQGDSGCIHRFWHGYLLVFPIVGLDSSFFVHDSAYVGCYVARNLHVAEQGDGYAILQWEHRPGQARYQISYGPSGITPGQGIIVECPINARSITGLDSCTHYVAYVRSVCERSTTLYSDWSDSISIYICDMPEDTTGDWGDSTKVVSPVESLTGLMPNPASGQVTVYSSFQLTGVTMYGLHGESVLEQPLEGHSATLDIGRLRPGVYIVMIHTSQGSVSRKLVVQ